MIEGLPFEPKGSSRDLLGDLLSDEETREILAPYPGDGGGSTEVVLLLTEDPVEAERITAYLAPRGVRTSPVTQRYVALDRLRDHEYRAFVMAVDALGSTPSAYLERVLETDGVPNIGFILPEEGPIPSWVDEEPAETARRPLIDRQLARLFPWVPEATLAEATSREAIRAPEPGEVDRSFSPPETEAGSSAVPAPADSPSSGDRSTGGVSRPNVPRSPGQRPPDWLTAVRRLLEARHEGRRSEEALRDWAETEPACAGWGAVAEDDGELTVRAGGEDRNALLAALAAELADLPEPPTTPSARGSFGCLPGDESWLAFWWRNDAAARGWERFAALVPLFDQLEGRETSSAAPGGNRSGSPAPENTAGRSRAARLLDGRMHAVRRHGGSVVVLLLEPVQSEDLVPLLEHLESRLRGEDAVELDPGRIWVILERTEPATPAAIEERLRDCATTFPFRSAGAMWRAGGPSAEELLDHLARSAADLPGDGTIEWS